MELEFCLVQHRYGRHIGLDGLDLRVASGEVHALMGATGCGKTTALRLAGLLTAPSAGTVHFDGKPAPRGGRARLLARRRTAMVHQEPVLLRGTVRHNVAWGLRARGVRGAELRERTEQALELLRLTDLADRPHGALSGGERKRTALAAAIATQPQMLLLDEPLSSTHPALRRSLRDQILAINRALGTTILMATHDLQDALALAGSLTVMDRGRAVQAGPVDEVLHHPSCSFIADFAGGTNLLRVTAGAGNVCRVGGLAIHAPEPAEPGAFLSIPPGHVLLSLDEPQTSARNRFRGIVRDMQPFDYGFLVSVACAGATDRADTHISGATARTTAANCAGASDANVYDKTRCTILSAVVTRGSVEELELAPGREVWLYFKVSAVRRLG